MIYWSKLTTTSGRNWLFFFFFKKKFFFKKRGYRRLSSTCCLKSNFDQFSIQAFFAALDSLISLKDGGLQKKQWVMRLWSNSPGFPDCICIEVPGTKVNIFVFNFPGFVAVPLCRG